MPDMLSQEEIDALLSAVSAGREETLEEKTEQPEQNVILYDFKRPNRVSKEQIKTFQTLHRSFATLFSSSLATYLRTVVEIDVTAVDQLTYTEFIMSLPSPTSIYLFNMFPLEGQAAMELNHAFVFAVVDRLLGGQGISDDQNREPTQIEQSVIRRIIITALRDLEDAWGHVNPDLRFQLVRWDTNPQFVQIASPGDTVILVSLEIKMPKVTGLMSICFPFLMLEPIIAAFSTQFWISETKKGSSQEDIEKIKNSMMGAVVDVKANLGKTEITVKDLIDLSVGDTIVLDKKVKDDLDVFIEDKVKFQAKPGVLGKNRGVQINKVMMNFDD